MRELESLHNIRLLVLDVDGVLTDGRTWQDSHGVWRRNFSVRDAIAIRQLRKSGYQIAVITDSHAQDISDHMKILEIDYFYEDCGDKPQALRHILASTGLSSSQVACLSACLGHSKDDFELLKSVGFAALVPNADLDLRRSAQYITKAEGGDGAVREICHLILRHTSFSANAAIAATKDQKKTASF
jgi:3-deoxy-D-manno-octulosonate 8-phosphate phosphatase (KDO 8-P phosphatase)